MRGANCAAEGTAHRMNAGQFLRNLGRYWWIVVLATIATGAGAAVLDAVRKPDYSGFARVVVRPSSKLTDSRILVDTVGQMGARYVTGTFAQTFTSEQVRVAAQQAVGLSVAEATRYPLQANVLPDTVVIEVSGTGPDPAVLAKYIDATVNATVQQTITLFGVMELQPLQTANVPPTPTSPRPLRDIPLGLALGLILGALLAWTLAYMREQQMARQTGQLNRTFWDTQAEWDERVKGGQVGPTQGPAIRGQGSGTVSRP
jgi:succinoglycan biosynthesis transport protein ExoP